MKDFSSGLVAWCIDAAWNPTDLAGNPGQYLWEIGDGDGMQREHSLLTGQEQLIGQSWTSLSIIRTA